MAYSITEVVIRGLRLGFSLLSLILLPFNLLPII